MLHPTVKNAEPQKERATYTVPTLRVLGTFQALTQTRTCAKGYNDGTASGCTKSAKKS